jgi:hypothetical protein
MSKKDERRSVSKSEDGRVSTAAMSLVKEARRLGCREHEFDDGGVWVESQLEWLAKLDD